MIIHILEGRERIMKKLFGFIILILSVMSLSSCTAEPSAEKMIGEFKELCGAEGIIYSPRKQLGEEGHIPEDLTKKIYLYDGDFPRNYAILLNSHSHKGSEAAIFVCQSEDERQKVTEMCLERIRIVADKKENAVIIRSGNIIAYSTLEDKELAERLLYKIIRRS